jgi:hypothetical protein
MDVSEAKRLKALEDESVKLKELDRADDGCGGAPGVSVKK